MSTRNVDDAMMMCCASCGVMEEVDDMKLKKCDGGCDLVKYCSDGCQGNHRDQHEEECKKRRAELRDRDLFTQPDESHLGECQICCLPLPLEESKSGLMFCCSQRICNGCEYANLKREFEAGLEHRCAFCREPVTKSGEEGEKKRMERIKKNDPAALWHMGNKRYQEGDSKTALNYWTKAAGLGDANAHYQLSIVYFKGQGVERDKKKEVYHAEEAAMKGNPWARHNLGCIEYENGRYERAVKHFIIAANLGYNDSLKRLKDLYVDGHASKEDYAGALRAYQAAVNATKSEDREKAEEALKSGEARVIV